MSTVLWVKLGSKGSSRVPCEKKGPGFETFGGELSGKALHGSCWSGVSELGFRAWSGSRA